MNPEGKVVLIAGGARIGASVAHALAGRGASVALSYRRSRAAAEKTAESIREAGGRGEIFQADLADAPEAEKLIGAVEDKFGHLDILVNMASRYEKEAFDALDAEAWERQMSVDARAAYLLSIAAAGPMRRAGEGRIVHFTDWLAASGRPRYRSFLPYYVAKSAVIGLTEALALELAPEILVNAIAPGPILAPPDMSAAESKKVRKQVPLGRWGGPQEIAKAVLYLVETDFVTGECLRVDGGRHLK